MLQFQLFNWYFPSFQHLLRLKDFTYLSKLDLRVGLVKSCKKHPQSDRLYLEEVDVGEPTPCQVISGLAHYIPIHEMQHRKVVVLCNLEPVQLRGITSYAMLVGASDGTKVELLDPPQNSIIGERIQVRGCNFNPLPIFRYADVWPKIEPVIILQHFTNNISICTPLRTVLHPLMEYHWEQPVEI